MVRESVTGSRRRAIISPTLLQPLRGEHFGFYGSPKEIQTALVVG